MEDGTLAALVHLLGFPAQTCPQFGRPLVHLAAIGLVKPYLKLGAEGVELTLLMVQQAHGFAHDFGRIWKSAAFDLLADARLDIGGELDRPG